MNESTKKSRLSKKRIFLTAILIILIGALSFGIYVVLAGQNRNHLISFEESIQVALDHSGFSQDEVSNLSGFFDKEDGFSVYEVTFKANGFEYEYNIDGNSGEVLSHSEERVPNSISDHDSDGNEGFPSDTASSSYIGVDRAKYIAVDYLDLDLSMVTFTKAKLDDDDGYHLYEIEFLSDQVEYEFEIDAKTGNILSWEHD